MNLFYYPDIQSRSLILNSEESKHLVRVLRMKEGDRVKFTDGKGYFYTCEVAEPNPRACELNVLEKSEGTDTFPGYLQIAIAPTKNIGRFEWFLEKSTEIGIDRISPAICKHSERRDIKTSRLEKVLIAAMKQSLKSHLPVLDQPATFEEIINLRFEGQKFIAYIDETVDMELSKAYNPPGNALVLVGPEGDFSPDEVEQARRKGFQPVSLGRSRLRTETAGVIACHTIKLLKELSLHI